MDSEALKKQRNELAIGFLIMGIFCGVLYGSSFGGNISTMIFNAAVNGIIGGGAGAAMVRILYLSRSGTFSMLTLGLLAIGLGALFLKTWGALAGVVILWAALHFQPVQDAAESKKDVDRGEEVIIPKKGDKTGIVKQ